MTTADKPTERKEYIRRLEEPPVAQALFGGIRWAWIWLIIRLYVGYEWLTAGIGKIGSPAWTGENAGAAINGFVNGALSQTGGEHPNVQAWYAFFLRNVVLPNTDVFGYIVAWGELLVGIGLIVGLFTGIAAFFGSFMNINYLLAGTVSTNPILFVLATFLVLAWRTAGWWGLDRWILPRLGTPWKPGMVFEERGKPSAEQEPQAA